MQRLDKKKRIKIYEEAIVVLKGTDEFLFKNGNVLMCHIFADIIGSEFKETKNGFFIRYKTEMLPEFHAQRPEHVKNKGLSVWFYGCAGDYAAANNKRVKVIENCIRMAKHNPLPAYQNLKPI